MLDCQTLSVQVAIIQVAITGFSTRPVNIGLLIGEVLHYPDDLPLETIDNIRLPRVLPFGQ